MDGSLRGAGAPIPMVSQGAGLQEISAWFMLRTGAAPFRAFENVSTWLAGPSAVELLRPPKVHGGRSGGWGFREMFTTGGKLEQF